MSSDTIPTPQASVAMGSVRPPVAIVHDYLNQRGGAEKVVLELSNLWPEAPIYTSLYRPESTFQEFRGRDIRTSFLDRLPVDRGFRNLFLLYPAAFRSLGNIEADVLISSSSGWAHMARPAEGTAHVVYCYTPARWLYGQAHLGRDKRVTALSPVVGLFRALDKRAARRPELYVATCENVRRRISDIYSRDSVVVTPPVDVERFVPSSRGERLLVISRLLPYKRVDLVVAAARRLGRGLDVVGDGPTLPELRRIAGPETRFHGTVSDQTVTQLLETCSAVCVAGEEDFGLVAVEAQAAGKPVVAFGRGGARETVLDGVTGVLFDRQVVADVAEAIVSCDRLETAPQEIADYAARFSIPTFREAMTQAVLRARRAAQVSHHAPPSVSR